VPLTELEQRPEHVRSTANVFELPTFYQYGIGSAGFGAWRELATHEMTTRWVIEECWPGFPLLHHARVLPLGPPSAGDDELGRSVDEWGSPAVRERVLAIQRSTSSVVLFMEHVPQTVGAWLRARIAAGPDAAAAACDLLEDQLRAGVEVMGAGGLLHFDAHFENLLTDGQQIYFADFGLALSSGFDLAPAEAAFFVQHRSYDRCYTVTHLARWLVAELLGKLGVELDEYLRGIAGGRAARELPAYAAVVVERHAPVAAAMSDFLRRLQTSSRATPYPAEELERLAS
jgi:hypothetical protein